MRRASMYLAALAAALAVAAAPAAATVIHKQEGSFNGSERPTFGAFDFLLPSDAVDQSSGDVWVTEAEYGGSSGKADAVDRFDASGKYAGVQITGEGPSSAGGTPQGKFSFGLGLFPGIAVDNSSVHSGDLYVSDTGHGVVDRFSSAGAFECQITAKKPGVKEEEEHECNGAAGSEPTGGPAGMEPGGLAVGSSGDLYVADRAHNAIDVFGPSGEYKRQITSPELGKGFGLGTIAVDSAGNLYVTNYTSNVVKFDASGQFVEVIGEKGEFGAVFGVGVDPKNDHVYVSLQSASEELRIAEYEATVGGDVLLDEFASVSPEAGIAVGPAGRVYAAELANFSGGNVLIFSPDIVVPTVAAQPATETTETSATLHGQVDPDAAHGGTAVTSCRFEYGPTMAYGETAPCEPGPSYSGPQDVSAKIEGLRPQSTYHFRVVATEANGIASYSKDATPLTTSGQPSVDLQAADAQETFVTFKAKIDPWGRDTTCQVQYETQQSFEESKPDPWARATTVDCPKGLGSGFGDVVTKFRVSGLARQTTYDYRFVASNQAGLSGHPSGTFETYGIQEYGLLDLKSSLGGREREEWTAGESETQAGAHPYEVASTINLSEDTVLSEDREEEPPVETEVSGYTGTDTKDISAELPPGLLGNPTVLPTCTKGLLHEEACPGDTQVGMIEIWLDENPAVCSLPCQNGDLPRSRQPTQKEPLFNVTPSSHVPAEFAARVAGDATASIPFHVRTGGDYGVTAESVDISTVSLVEKVRVRVWGVPAAHVHDPQRYCQVEGKKTVDCASDQPLKPLLRSPTSCTGPHTETAAADTWNEPGEFVRATTEVRGFTGCGRLPFEPGFEARPTTSVADSPSGLHVDLHMPQPEGCKEEAGKVECGLGEADLKDATVTLPAGVTVDPSSADGLGACTEAQIGYLPRRSAQVGRPQFTPGRAECPDSSKIGTVEVDTPLLDHPLSGAVYVATQDANPFGSLLALYVAVYDARTGVVLKLPGRVTLDPQTGRLTTTFDQNPQLPFEDFKLDFFGGSRASLTTPLACGSYSVSTDLVPWSAPEGADATPSSLPFTIASAPGGGGCVSGEGQAPNGPGFEAGTASPVAATYSPFVLHLSREDGSQRFSGLSVALAPGLIGKIAGVQQCPQSAIDTAIARSHEGEGAVELAHPSCPAGSEVGVVHVGSGSGAPYYVTGHAYFAGPYEGAPFSMVIVTPALAGPFDLGTVVVRAGLYIDPNTAQVTVKSDPFPTILDGIPLDIRSISVDVNRGEFTLNPTSCQAMSVTGQESSTAGQTAGLSDRFQAGGCATLPFHPVFSAVTSGRTSRQSGASLTVHVESSMGQANIAKVHVSLPQQLPSRLETLRLACPDRVFATNAASCPSGSAVGIAVAHTPILSSPLTGPAYLVSHGGAAFPDLEVILQGEGVTIVLDGKTDIKHGITTSTFESIPDAPVSSFDLSLPEGPHSILAAPGSLCAATTVLVKKRVTVRVRYHGRLHKRRVTRRVRRQVKGGGGLVMPTMIQGQNGAVIKQNTMIGVQGCARAAVKHKKPRRHVKRGRRKSGKKHG